MTQTYLDAIGAFHRKRAAADSRQWQERHRSAYDGPSFRDALLNNANVSVIAEVKRRSPSKGWLNEDLDAPALAALYERAGARAISVLTDQPHFGARDADLPSVASAVTIPRLRKDFTVCENDVLDAREMGASAVLLIAALLDDDELVTLSSLAAELNLGALFEVHDKDEVSRSLSAGAMIIGVNQRNLQTFAVDPTHAARVAEVIPDDVVRVAESGLRTPSDVHNAGQSGFDAVLVGESFVTSADPFDDVAAFCSVPRRD